MKRSIKFSAALILLVVLFSFEKKNQSEDTCNVDTLTIKINASAARKIGTRPDTVNTFSYYQGAVITENTIFQYCVESGREDKKLALLLADTLNSDAFIYLTDSIVPVNGILTIDSIDYEEDNITFQAIRSEIGDTLDFYLYFRTVNTATNDTINCILDPKLQVSGQGN